MGSKIISSTPGTLIPYIYCAHFSYSEILNQKNLKKFEYERKFGHLVIFGRIIFDE